MVKFLKFVDGVWPGVYGKTDEAKKYEFMKGMTTLELIYEGGDALEAFYYLVVDLLRKRGYEVLKISDWYSISERSQEWGSQQMKIHHQINDASNLMKYINDMLKSFVAMKKDHQRIKESLEYFGKEGKAPDDLVLKGIWVDFVDTKSGAASLAQTSKNLEMFAVRDWFFRIEDPDKVDEMLKDTNVRIKSYLKRKLREYQTWKKHWQNSLREFDKVLKDRLKVNKKTIDLYKQWVKPLLRNIDSLQMGGENKEGKYSSQSWRLDPELLKVSTNLLSKVKLVAFKVNKEDWKGSYVGFVQPQREKKYSVPYVGVIDIDINVYAGAPGGYQRTKVEMISRIYESYKFKEMHDSWNKDEVEELFKDLMLDEKFTEKVEEDIKKAKLSESNLAFEGLYRSLKSYFKKDKKKKKKSEDPIPRARRSLGSRLFGSDPFGANQIMQQLMKDQWWVYDTMKKAFFMLKWPVDDKDWAIDYLIK